MLSAVGDTGPDKDNKAKMEGRKLVSVAFHLLIPVISKTKYAQVRIL